MLTKLKRYVSLPVYEQWYLLEMLLYRLKGVLLYRRVFGSFGAGSTLYPAAMIRGARHIHIGRNVTIRRGVRLEAATTDPAHPAEIRIGDNVNIEQNVHIAAQGSIVIGEGVSLSAHTAIMCGTHPFWDVRDPRKIADRPGDATSRVEIGAGTLVGIGALILNNVRLGRGCVVGSGAVVKKGAGEFCVLEGNPAQKTLQYDAGEERWMTVAKAPTHRSAMNGAPIAQGA